MDEIELSSDFNALDAVDACEKLTATARDIDVDAYRVAFSHDEIGVPADTIQALQVALAAVEAARTLVARDLERAWA